MFEEGGDAEEAAFFFPGGHYLDAYGEAGFGEAAGDGDGGAACEGEGEGEYEPAYVGGEGVVFDPGEVADVHVVGGFEKGFECGPMGMLGGVAASEILLDICDVFPEVL